MRILFVHQNFPGQFRHLVPALARDPAHQVVGFGMRDYAGPGPIRMVRYDIGRASSPTVHPWVSEIEAKVIRGEAAWRAATALKAEGFTPDLIYAHPAWGESIFLKDVWPDARLVLYCEFFYRDRGADVGFDPEFEDRNPDVACRLRMKNVNNLLNLDIADGGVSPTRFQRDTYPEALHSRIEVIHDGIDTDRLHPDPNKRAAIDAGQDLGLPVGAAVPRQRISLGRDDEVITFVNRNLEPYRGYHIFMRALPEILRRRPKAHVLIVGGFDVSYGPRAPEGRTWRDIFLDEVKDRLDRARVHFLGYVPYDVHVSVLQLSTVHVYLTYPFVVSWSLLEAMSCGAAIVASDTAPVREMVVDGETGRVVDFFSPDGLAAAVDEMLGDAETRRRLGANARAFACGNYDLQRVCLPRQLAYLLGR